MKPFFCRTGAKTRLTKYILPLFPQHEIYIEPFLGSGAVFWAKNPSKVEILNDLDPVVIKNLKLLKSASSNLDDYKIQSTIPNIQKFVDKDYSNTNNLLLKNLYTSCNTFSTKGVGKIYRKTSGFKKIDKINDYKNRLKNVKIYNKDYEYIIKKYDSNKTFFYLDPPYEDSKNLYTFGNFDFIKFKNILDKIKGKFILSLNDSVNIRNLFKNYKIKTVKIIGNKQNTIGSKDRTELLITNF